MASIGIIETVDCFASNYETTINELQSYMDSEMKKLTLIIEEKGVRMRKELIDLFVKNSKESEKLLYEIKTVKANCETKKPEKEEEWRIRNKMMHKVVMNIHENQKLIKIIQNPNETEYKLAATIKGDEAQDERQATRKKDRAERAEKIKIDKIWTKKQLSHLSSEEKEEIKESLKRFQIEYRERQILVMRQEFNYRMLETLKTISEWFNWMHRSRLYGLKVSKYREGMSFRVDFDIDKELKKEVSKIKEVSLSAVTVFENMDNSGFQEVDNIGLEMAIFNHEGKFIRMKGLKFVNYVSNLYEAVEALYGVYIHIKRRIKRKENGEPVIGSDDSEDNCGSDDSEDNCVSDDSEDSCVSDDSKDSGSESDDSEVRATEMGEEECGQKRRHH